MRFENVAIASYGTFLPDEAEKTLTSEEIEKRLAPLYQRLGLSSGRLEWMTGIKERRYWDEGTRPSFLSLKAAQRLFAKSPFQSPREVDLLIHASVCRDYLEPATASYVHEGLGLRENCPFFDLSNACLGALNAFVLIGELIERGAIRSGLVVTGENGGPLIFQTIEMLLSRPDLTRKGLKKYLANLTIGAGAAAFLLTHRERAPQAPRLLGGVMCGDTQANHLCRGNGDTRSLAMETDSPELLKAGVALMQKTWALYKEDLGPKASTLLPPDWALGHQVGAAHEKAVLEALGLHHCPSYSTYERLGNTGSAALPITLAELGDSGKAKKGDTMVLLGIGSGLSSIILGIEWGAEW